MDCADIPSFGPEAFPWVVKGIRRPFQATLEITQRCNNRCVHCYADPGGAKPPDLPFEFWVDVLDALVADECLFVSFSGGEPLLSKDFPALWREAKQRGLVATLLTNACLVDDKLLELFAALPPKRVSISLYGATRETYEAVSCAPGSFDAAMRGVDLLRRAGIPISLKTMLLRSNSHEIDALTAFADSLGTDLGVDGCILPTFDGNCRVLAERLSPDETVDIEQRTPGKREAMELAWEKNRAHPINKCLFTCRAGMSNLHVDAQGRVMPCAGAGTTAWPLDRDDVAGSLKRIFYEEMPPVLWNEDAGDSPCARCELQALCGTCPVGRALEAGSPRTPTAYGCRVALRRAQSLGIDAVPAAREFIREPWQD